MTLSMGQHDLEACAATLLLVGAEAGRAGLDDVARPWKDSVVRVEKNYEPNLPQVPLDESLCEQAFVNIVQNAYDAMGAGGGTLRVKVRHVRSDHRSSMDGVEVRIADTGPGIPTELREQIFNPFVTTKKTGVGLGLSIVSKIIDGHHGSIRIESRGVVESGTAAVGTCFVMFFPAAREGNATSEPAHLVIL